MMLGNLPRTARNAIFLAGMMMMTVATALEQMAENDLQHFSKGTEAQMCERSDQPIVPSRHS